MKSLIKFLSLTLLIAAPAFAAQQQREQKQNVNDARQYLAEQESKRKYATSADQALAQQLQQEEDASAQKDAQILAHEANADEEIRKWLIEKGQDKAGKPLAKLATLPLPILHNVVEFHYGDPQKLKFIANNMEQLIPAILDWDFTIFDKLKSAKNLLQAGSQKTTMVRLGSFYSSNYHACPANHRVFAGDPNSFVAYSFPKNKVLFKVCPRKLKSLMALPTEQLGFLTSLYDLYREVSENVIPNNPQINYILRVELDEEQQKKYFALPEEVRDCLDANYGDDDVDTMPFEMVVHLLPTLRLERNQELIFDIPENTPDQNNSQENR